MTYHQTYLMLYNNPWWSPGKLRWSSEAYGWYDWMECNMTRNDYQQTKYVNKLYWNTQTTQLNEHKMILNYLPI